MEMEDRIDLLRVAKKSGKKIAMYLVEDKDTAQFRYRVFNIMQAMDYDESTWQAVYFLNTEIDDLIKYIDDIDLLIILRQTAKDTDVLDLIDLAHRKNKKVLFDIDDLVFDFKYLRILMRSTNSLNIFYWSAYVYGIRRIAKKVDGFLTTNEFLGEKIKESFDKLYQVIPNSLNNKQVRIFDEKKKTHDGFIVGYFSGSPTHAKDLKMIEPGIVKFLDEHPDAHLWVIGFMEFSGVMWNQIRRKRVEVMDYAGYLKMQSLLEEVDVNIAPLVINDFTNSKSELKFFEAAAAETVTIASPAYAFKNSIEDGVNGFLAEPDEWYEKLEFLYENPKERKKVAKNARKYALENYYGEKFLKAVEKAYDHFV